MSKFLFLLSLILVSVTGFTQFPEPVQPIGGVNNAIGIAGKLYVNKVFQVPIDTLNLPLRSGAIAYKNGFYYSWDSASNRWNRTGTLTVEVDPIALAKTIQVIGSTGINVSPLGPQALSTNPVFTISAIGGGGSPGITRGDLSALNPILYDSSSGTFSLDTTTGHHTIGLYNQLYMDTVFAINDSTNRFRKGARTWDITTHVNRVSIESDPVALAKVITINHGYGVIIPETPGQALGLPPSWTPRVDTFAIQTRARGLKIADSLMAKPITLNAGYGIKIAQAATQTLGTPPSWTPVIDTNLISTRAWRDKLKDSLVALPITLNAGYGLIIPQAPSQALGLPPVWTPRIDSSLIATHWDIDSLAALGIAIFNTIAEMQAYTGVLTDAIVRDTMRGGIFHLKLSGYTHDGGVSFVATGLGGGTKMWLRKMTQSNVFNVRWWGAKGDGVTDDLPAMQAGENYITSKAPGGTLYFPAVDRANGKYYMDTLPIYKRSHVNWLGDGWGSVIRNPRQISNKAGSQYIAYFGNTDTHYDQLVTYDADSIYGNRIKLHTTGESSNFHTGDILAYKGMTALHDPDGNIKPQWARINRVDSVLAGGIIVLEDATDSIVRPMKVAVTGHYTAAHIRSGNDEYGVAMYFVSDCKIQSMAFESEGQWTQRYSGYKVDADNLFIKAAEGISFNAFARCNWSNIHVIAWKQAVELSMYTHDSRITNYDFTWINRNYLKVSAQPLIKFGEFSTNVQLSGFKIIAGKMKVGTFLTFQNGIGNSVTNSTFFGDTVTQAAVIFQVSDDSAITKNNRVQGNSFDGGNQIGFYVKTEQNAITKTIVSNNSTIDNKFYRGNDVNKAISINGTGNLVSGSYFPHGVAGTVDADTAKDNQFVNLTFEEGEEFVHGAIYVGSIRSDGNRNTWTGIQGFNRTFTGGYNAVFGANALTSLTSGFDNQGFGYRALNHNTSGFQNTVIGSEAGYNNTIGASNVFIAWQAGYNNTTGTKSTAVGVQALRNNTTESNHAYGYQSLFNTTTGKNNSAFGYQSMLANISGQGNTAFGRLALSALTDGNNNIAIGLGAAYNQIHGSNNLIFGTNIASLEWNVSNTVNIRNGLIGRSVGESDSTFNAGVNGSVWGINIKNPTAFFHLPASIQQRAQLRLQKGVIPNDAGSNEGDVTYDSVTHHSYIRIDGVWRQLDKDSILDAHSGGTGTREITTGSIVYVGTNGVLRGQFANLNYDSANHAVGIGTSTPTAYLDIRSSVNNRAQLRLRGSVMPNTANLKNGDIVFDSVNNHILARIDDSTRQLDNAITSGTSLDSCRTGTFQIRTGETIDGIAGPIIGQTEYTPTLSGSNVLEGKYLFQVIRNNIPDVPGVDDIFNSETGKVTFTQPANTDERWMLYYTGCANISDTVVVVPPDTSHGTAFGIMIAGNDLSNSEKVSVAGLYGVNYIRVGVTLNTYNGNSQYLNAIEAAGKKVILNLDWKAVGKDGAGNRVPNNYAQPSEWAAYDAKVNSVLTRYHDIIEFCVIENEPTVDIYWGSFPISGYINLLNHVIPIVHAHGLLVADGAIHVELITGVMAGGSLSANEQQVKDIIDAYPSLALDYTNIHTRGIGQTYSTNLKGVVDYIRAHNGGKPVVSNEYHLESSFPSLIQSMVAKMKQAAVKYSLPYDAGNGGSGAGVSFHNLGSVSLNALGTAYRDVIALP